MADQADDRALHETVYVSVLTILDFTYEYHKNEYVWRVNFILEHILVVSYLQIASKISNTKVIQLLRKNLTHVIQYNTLVHNGAMLTQIFEFLLLLSITASDVLNFLFIDQQLSSRILSELQGKLDEYVITGTQKLILDQFYMASQ